MKVLTNPTVVIISQNMLVLHHPIVHLKLNVICQVCLNKAGKNKVL